VGIFVLLSIFVEFMLAC